MGGRVQALLEGTPDRVLAGHGKSGNEKQVGKVRERGKGSENRGTGKKVGERGKRSGKSGGKRLGKDLRKNHY